MQWALVQVWAECPLTCNTKAACGGAMGVLCETGDYAQSCDPLLVMGTEEEKMHFCPGSFGAQTLKALPQSTMQFSPRELILWVLGAKLKVFQHSAIFREVCYTNRWPAEKYSVFRSLRAQQGRPWPWSFLSVVLVSNVNKALPWWFITSHQAQHLATDWQAPENPLSVAVLWVGGEVCILALWLETSKKV